MPQDLKNMKLFVATPSCRDWKRGFGSSMIKLTSHLTVKWCKGELGELYICDQPASLLPLGREILLDKAQKIGATHILWIDDDTDFLTECVDSLLSHDVDYVACNMMRKKFPLTATAYDKDNKSVSSIGKSGLEEVFHVGLGMTLIRMDVLNAIPCPHFQVTWLPELCTYQGEDMYLCDLLRANGVKMYVDHDASQFVAHVGDFSYETPKAEFHVKQQEVI